MKLTVPIKATLKTIRIPVRAKKYHLLIQQSQAKNNASFWLGMIKTLSAIDELNDLIGQLPDTVSLKVKSIETSQFRAVRAINKFLLDFVNTRASHENMELIINTGVVSELDELTEKKAKVEMLIANMNKKLQKLKFKTKIDYLQEAGFMMCVEAPGQSGDTVKQQLNRILPQAKLITSTNQTFFFQSPKLLKLNEEFGDPWRQMVEIKNLIENVMINKLAEITPELIVLESACSELEAFISLAKYAKARILRQNLVFFIS